MSDDRPAEIFVRFQAEGWHQWPEAPNHRSYLAQRHRHQFHVEVRCEVHHDDREIEFHDLLDEARKRFPGGHLGRQSCEDMARELGEQLAKQYRRPFSISVAEDGEVGALVRIDRPQ